MWGHGDDLRQILIQGRSDSVLLIASGVDGMELVARKTAGFLVSVQLSQLGAGNRQKTRCAYQCEIAPWRPSLLVVSRPCSSATSGSQRVTAARHWHRSATLCSAPAWNPTGSTRISPPGAMTPVRVSPPASRRGNPATRQHARALETGPARARPEASDHDGRGPARPRHRLEGADRRRRSDRHHNSERPPGLRHFRGIRRVRARVDRRTHSGGLGRGARPWPHGRQAAKDGPGATLTMAMAAMSDPKANAAKVARTLGVTTTTLYAYVNGDGSPKPAGPAVLAAEGERGKLAVSS